MGYVGPALYLGVKLAKFSDYFKLRGKIKKTKKQKLEKKNEKIHTHTQICALLQTKCSVAICTVYNSKQKANKLYQKKKKWNMHRWIYLFIVDKFYSSFNVYCSVCRF